MTDDSPAHASPLAFVVRGIVTGLILAVALHAGYVLVAGNFRTSLPGQVYRCAQPGGPRLERLVRLYGIRTVVNLRGAAPSAAWYRAEARATARMDVSLEDVSLSATRLPSTVALRQLLDILDRSAYPILLHCHQGADRTGLASAMAHLLRTDATPTEARAHLSLRCGHLSFGKTGQIDRFLDLYEGWLASLGEPHSPALLRAWVQRHYCPDDARATFEYREALVARGEGYRPLLRMRANQGRLLGVRCRNDSHSPWRLQPGANVGIHLAWTLLDHDQRVVKTERVGLFHATVGPGEHVDLTLALPPLDPGRYQLRVDLTNEQRGYFAQFGNDPSVIELEVS